MTDRPTAISRAIARSRGRAIDRDRSIDRRFTRARERGALRSSRSLVRARSRSSVTFVVRIDSSSTSTVVHSNAVGSASTSTSWNRPQIAMKSVSDDRVRGRPLTSAQGTSIAVNGKMTSHVGEKTTNDVTTARGREANANADGCFDWNRGACARGSECRFAHGSDVNGNNGNGKGNGSMTNAHGVGRGANGGCFDYAKGACRRGDLCRFSHEGGNGKNASAASSTAIASTGVGGSGRLNIPKPLPVSGLVHAGGASAGAGAGAGASAGASAGAGAQRSGAIDYASVAKSKGSSAMEGSFAAALAGKKTVAVATPPPPPPMPPAPAEKPAVTASGTSVPAPRFSALATTVVAPSVGATVVAAPSFQFGTGTMLAGDQAESVAVVSGIMFGTKAPAMPVAMSASSAAKAYPKPEFAFGTGSMSAEALVPVAAIPIAGLSAGFVPPIPSGPPPVPAGRPPEANQRVPQAHAPGFGFAQPGFGLARAPEKPVSRAPPVNAWGGAMNGVSAAAAPASGANASLGSEWDISMGMGLDIGGANGMGTYDALGGPSPFGGFGGLGSLFSQAPAASLDDGVSGVAAPRGGMWGAGGYGF